MSNECLQCGKPCGDDVFCAACQEELLQRSQQGNGDNGAVASPDKEVDSPEEWMPLVVHLPSPEGVGVPAAHIQVATDATPDSLLNNSPVMPENSPVAAVTQLAEKRDELADQLAQVQTRKTAAVDPHTRPIVPLSLPQGRVFLKKGKWPLFRLIFLALIVLGVIVILIDGGLLALILQRQSQGTSSPALPPLITLTPSVVHPGEVAVVTISHFPAQSRVLLTRDIDEPARLEQTTPFVRVNNTGSATVRIFVDDSWGLGTHYIDSEDVSTHYTASTTVQVISTNQERPPLLSIDQRTLDMGTDYVGANTLQSLTLKNSGGGVINWSAASSQSWLQVTPEQGTFTTRQPVTIAASRAHLLPGQYTAMITFTSNAGPALIVHISMIVRALPSKVGAVISVAEPALAFVATDGGADPASETLTVSNPGTETLHWSAKELTPTLASDQNIPLATQSPWLSVQPAKGDVAPGMTATVHVSAHIQTLLPGSYSSVLSFSSGTDVQNAPQSVAVSLSIMQRCSPSISLSSLSLTGPAGSTNAAHQDVSVSLSTSCSSSSSSSSLSWKGFSLTSGLVLSPDHGTARSQGDSRVTLKVDSSRLAAGSYTGSVIFVSAQRTQTIPVQFTLVSTSPVSHKTPGVSGQQTQPSSTSTVTSLATATAAASAKSSSASSLSPQKVNATATPISRSGQPLLAVSATSLTFAMGQGQNSAPQTITVTNEDSVPVTWQVTPDTQGILSLSLSGNTLAAGKSEQLVIQPVTSDLQPGHYDVQLLFTATDSSGTAIALTSPTVPVSIQVNLACVITAVPSTLSFISILTLQGPPTQSISLYQSGYCVGTVSWSASVSGNSSGWLSLSATSGNIPASGTSVSVAAYGQTELLGWNRAQIVFSAVDGNGNTLEVNGHTVTVTMNVLL